MMKAALLLFAMWFAGLAGMAAETSTNPVQTIRPAEARLHLNAAVVVAGKIVEVNKAEKVVRLNFEKPFPNQPLQAVIFAEKTNLFPTIDKLQGKIVEVSGTIGEYRGRPQIIITQTNQVRVLEGGAR